MWKLYHTFVSRKYTSYEMHSVFLIIFPYAHKLSYVKYDICYDA